MVELETFLMVLAGRVESECNLGQCGLLYFLLGYQTFLLKGFRHKLITSFQSVFRCVLQSETEMLMSELMIDFVDPSSSLGTDDIIGLEWSGTIKYTVFQSRVGRGKR